jgi:hypothetical protein
MRGSRGREPRPGASRLSVLGAAIFCIAPGIVGADEFFLVRDENPMIRGFYLPLPSDARLNAGAGWSATFSLSNTLDPQVSAGQNLLVNGESDTLRLTFDDALFHSWRYRFTLPVIHDSGGILDPAIDSWHQLLGLPQGSRPYYPKNKLVYSYTGLGHVNIDVHQAGTSVGDFAGELGWYPIDDARRTLSFWGGLEAPTGSVSNLTGDGAWDGALWAHGALRWPRWQLAAELGVAQPFGDEIFAGYAHKTSEFARFSATRAMGPLWSLRAQLDGQTARLSDNNIRFLGPSLQLTFGFERRLGGRWRIDFGLAEDAGVNTVPDITFFLGIRG